MIATVRQSAPALESAGVQVETGVEITDDDSIAALARRLDGVVLDEVICNAGILRQDDLDSLDLADVRRRSRSTRSGRCAP